ncbi:MAG: hypothetical protein COA42_13610 [Alteromonadaceae bacterium]|nr:MAG: hypothetical protein COA42_13610 [Alteromonadaceae bacterium]
MAQNIEIPPGWKLPKEIVRRLGSRAGKQRVIAERGHILLVLHKPPLKNESHRKSVFFWRNAEGVWGSSERGAGLTGLDEYLDNYERIEDALDEAYEKAVNARDFFDLLEQLAPVQRSVQNMSKALQAAREVAGEVFIDSRDKAEELSRNIELLYIDSKNGLDYAMAKRAEEQAEMQKKALTAGHRLNIIMALFLPITAVASLLGMNIPHGLEKSESWVFFAILGVCGLLGVFMRFLVLKKPKVDVDV